MEGDHIITKMDLIKAITTNTVNFSKKIEVATVDEVEEVTLIIEEAEETIGEVVVDTITEEMDHEEEVRLTIAPLQTIRAQEIMKVETTMMVRFCIAIFVSNFFN